MKKLTTVFVFALLASSHTASAQEAEAPDVDIFRAIEAGDLDRVRTLVTENQKILEVYNRRKDTPLHCAAASGNLELTQYLINAGANIYAPGGCGELPLHHAAKAGHTAIMQLFLDASIPVDQADGNKSTALHWASRSKDPQSYKAVVFLINKGANPIIQSASSNNKPLHRACVSGHEEKVKFLLTHGAVGDINARNARNATPLFHAVGAKSMAIKKFLLEHDADPDVSCFETGSLLNYTVLFGTLSIAEYLINYHPEIRAEDTRNLDGKLPGWREKKVAFEKAQKECLMQICLPKDIAHLVMTFTKKLEPEAS